jgi:hypothetical protein
VGPSQVHAVPKVTPRADPECASPGATNGMVPRSSSNLDGVASELLVRGLRICLDHPAVHGEVRRILMEHAGNEGASRTNRGGLAWFGSSTELWGS